MSPRSLPTPLLVALLVLLLAGPATAGTWRGDDPVGDADGFTFSPQPPPCGTYTDVEPTVGDIRGLHVRHDRHRVRLRLSANALPVDSARVTFHLATARGQYEVDVAGRGRDHRSPTVFGPQRPTRPETDECGGYSYLRVGGPCGARATLTERSATLVLPRRCLGGPSWVRVGASLQAEERGEQGDMVSVLDRWVPAGEPEPPFWRPYLGPRVRPTG